MGRQLADGLLDRLPAGYRRLIERLVFERITVDQISQQDGIPLTTVRLNVKNLLRYLAKRGLADHVATAADVARVTAPQQPQHKLPPMSRAELRRRLDELAGREDYLIRLARLDDATRAACEMLRLEGAPWWRVAEHFGLSAEATRIRLRRAILTLTADEPLTAKNDPA